MHICGIQYICINVCDTSMMYAYVCVGCRVAICVHDVYRGMVHT